MLYVEIRYGYLSPEIAQNFFPQQGKLIGIASTLAIFFIGYLARPLGALFLDVWVIILVVSLLYLPQFL